MKLAAVYFRGDDSVFVVPCAGGAGYSFEIDPVIVSDAREKSLAIALEQGLAASPGAGSPYDHLPHLDPVVRSAGCKSRAAFERGTAFIKLLVSGHQSLIKSFRPYLESTSGYTIDRTTILEGFHSPADLSRGVLVAAQLALRRPAETLRTTRRTVLTAREAYKIAHHDVPEIDSVPQDAGSAYTYGRQPPRALYDLDDLVDSLLRLVEHEVSTGGGGDLLSRITRTIETLARFGDSDTLSAIDSLLDAKMFKSRHVRPLLGKVTRRALKKRGLADSS